MSTFTDVARSLAEPRSERSDQVQAGRIRCAGRSVDLALMSDGEGSFPDLPRKKSTVCAVVRFGPMQHAGIAFTHEHAARRSADVAPSRC